MKPAILLILLCACSHPSDDATGVDFTDLKAHRQEIVQSFDEAKLERCDRITFVSLFDAYGRQIDLFKYQGPAGKWNRDIEPCFKDGQDVGSSSECSLDGYLSVMHALWSRKDMHSLQQMHDHLSSNNWKCGDGDTSATDILALAPILRHMLGQALAPGESTIEFSPLGKT